MFEFMFESANAPFTIAIFVMLGIAVLEGAFLLLGFGLFQFLDTLVPDVSISSELDMSPDIDSPSAISRFLSWLRIGKVPLLMLLVVFLTSFGILGLILQSIVNQLLGVLLPAWLAVIPIFFLTLPVVRVSGIILEKVMPGDETDVISEDALIGHVAILTLGRAQFGSPAEAKARDQHGTTHYVMVEPEQNTVIFERGDKVLLVQRNGATFKAIAADARALTD
jgi:hypothetical protein